MSVRPIAVVFSILSCVLPALAIASPPVALLDEFPTCAYQKLGDVEGKDGDWFEEETGLALAPSFQSGGLKLDSTLRASSRYPRPGKLEKALKKMTDKAAKLGADAVVVTRKYEVTSKNDGGLQRRAYSKYRVIGVAIRTCG